MATLERVMQMRQSGMSDPQIIQTLRQEGASPREIEESLSTSKVKYALDENQNSSDADMPPLPENPEMGMSMASQDYQETMPQMQEAMAPPQEYYPEYQGAGGGQYPEYQTQQPLDIEVINEIVEQTVDEKVDSIKKQISSFTKFKEDAIMELGKIDERITTLEDNFNELQMAILKKMGDFGNDVQNISKEMQESQYSFSKVLNPLADNIRELQRISEQLDRKSSSSSSEQNNKTFKEKKAEEERPKPKEERKVTKKPKPSFEEYLR